MKQKLMTKRKKKESVREMHIADAEPCKKLSVVVKRKAKCKQTKLKTEKLNNNGKQANKEMAREEHASGTFNDVDDIDLARDVARRTSTYVNSLSKAEKEEFESLRKWAQGYDVSLHKGNSISKYCYTNKNSNNNKKKKQELNATIHCVNANKRAKCKPLCKESEEREQEMKYNRMNKNTYAETSEWEENSKSSESSSEPSWLSESDDNIGNEDDSEVEETDNDDNDEEEGNESEGDVRTRTNVTKGGIFRSNDDI